MTVCWERPKIHIDKQNLQMLQTHVLYQGCVSNAKSALQNNMACEPPARVVHHSAWSLLVKILVLKFTIEEFKEY